MIGQAADIAAGKRGYADHLATTVAIGFSALLTVPISELRSIGIAGLLVTVECMLCTFIVPWVLGRLGHPQCRQSAVSQPGDSKTRTAYARE